MRGLVGLRWCARSGRVVDEDDSLSSRLAITSAGVGNSLAVDIDSRTTFAGGAVIGPV